MAAILDVRRDESANRLQLLRNRLVQSHKLCAGKACVYVTGSFGRGEASKHSDLDLFIVGQGTADKRALSRLDEILVKAELIKATRDMDFPPFSGDGQYLVHHTVRELVEMLGDPKDDVLNTFTERLLLLLESVPLVGSQQYDDVISDAINEYWRDFAENSSEFYPAFLTNDILRLWRTFCVNYEARTAKTPPEQRAKRKLKNYKLKHSRMLTCYSAIAYLLAVFSIKGTVSPKDAIVMVKLNPIQRLLWIRSESRFSPAHSKIDDLISCYEDFLRNTDAPENELIARFRDAIQAQKYRESAFRFGDVMFQLMQKLGEGSVFYRLLIV